MTITLPLSVTLGRKTKADKRFALNLNVYRNSHFQILNQAKRQFKEELMAELLALKKVTPPLRCCYTLFVASKRRTDLGNVLSVVQKFTEDALVETGILPDDDYEVIREVVYRFGGIDRDNPRVELEVERYG